MDWRKITAHKFRIRLGFKQYHVILTKVQLALTKIMSSFGGENMHTQYNILRYRIELSLHDHYLAIEIDENENRERNIGWEIKKQIAIEQELGCKYMITDPQKNTLMLFKLSIKYLDTLNN